MTLPSGEAGKVNVYIGSAVVGSSTIYWHDITGYTQTGWSINRIERGESALSLKLGNPGGKFTDSTFDDYLEVTEDFPVVFTYDQGVYFYGQVFKPPLKDDASGGFLDIEINSRLYLFTKEDVVKRYNFVEYATVEDVIYDIIYNATALNGYYGVTYTKPDIGDRHKLLRNFVFNNKDAQTVLKELTEYHNLNITMTVDTDGVDVITLSRSQVKNKALGITETLDDGNTVSIARERGSDVFFNRVKAIGRSDDGQVYIGEQQDLYSIKADGLRVRPTENIGTVENQLEVQRYAEYLIGKYSRDNYTTTVVLDPTKIDEDELWGLNPLDIVKVTSTRTGVGTDQKFRVVSVDISGDTDQITTMSMELNHLWRSAFYMQFEETPNVYDDAQEQEDEELVESRLMTATLDVKGKWNIYNGSDNHYPSTSFDEGGFPGLTDMGKMLIKSNWMRDPIYGANGLPADPFTMRISKVWPLNEEGNVIGTNKWVEHADALDNTVTSGASGTDFHYASIFEYNITPSSTFNAYGLLAASRYGGQITEFGDKKTTDLYTLTNEFIVDDPQFLRKGMDFTIVTEDGDDWVETTSRITVVDQSTGKVTTGGYFPILNSNTGTLYWFSDCFPVAEAIFDTAVSCPNGVRCYLRYNLRFFNDAETYEPNNLSIVTKAGLASIANRLRLDYFGVIPDTTNAQSYPPPTFMGMGLNDTSPVETAVDDDDTALNHEIARTTYIETAIEDVTTVSDSAKVTAKFSSLDVPPEIARTELSANAALNATTIYVDDVDGFKPEDTIFFGDTGGGGYTFTAASLAVNVIKGVGAYDSGNSGYGIALVHDLSLAKLTNTQVTTGKIKSSILKPIKEFGLWDKEAVENSDECFYLGENTGDSTNTDTVEIDEGGANSGLGFGDFQYDHLEDEDSLSKESDVPPYYFSKQATGTFDYLKHIKGFGFTTVPLAMLRSGKLSDPITFSTETTYGRTPSLSTVNNHFKRSISGTWAASQVSPLGNSSHTNTENKGRKENSVYLASQWRFYKGQTPRDEKSFWFSNELALYENYYAAEQYVFSISHDITKADLKDINLVWRGTAKSYDGSDYRDGIDFYVWHFGDYQPEYVENDDGVYEVIGRIGDARTFYPHWEKIVMVDGDGTEPDDVIGGDMNSFKILVSRNNTGSDNQEGINNTGYYLSPDGRISILAVTKYKGDYDTTKLSAINTDFVGLTAGTGHILDGEEIFFEAGVDYLYDPAWDFVAWPILDFYWNPITDVYDKYYNLTEVTQLSADANAGASSLYKNPSSLVAINTDDVLLLEDGATHEIVNVRSAGYYGNRFIQLTAPLQNTFPAGSRIFKQVFNEGPQRMSIFNTEVKPNYPSRTFTLQGLTTTEGYSSLLASDAFKGNTTISTDLPSGFRDGDIICLLRYPDVDDEYKCGYEWGTNAWDGSITLEDGLAREDIDNDSAAYDSGNDRSVAGIIAFDVPEFDSTQALSWGISDGTWSDGDAASSKWRLRNPKWGPRQYGFIEGKLQTAAGLLRTDRTPRASIGSGYSGWNSYNGPGLKIEWYDKTNGAIWVTKAIDMTLRDGHDSDDTNSQQDLEDYVYYRAKLHLDSHNVNGDTEFRTEGGFVASRGFNAYDNGNRVPSSGNTVLQYPIMIARNGIIKLDNNNSAYSDNDDLYYQLSIGEMYDATTNPFEGGADQEIVIKYRCLEAADATCIKTDDDADPDKTWYLDAPMFEHENFGTGGGEFRYHDPDDGNVWFIIDCCLSGSGVSQTDKPDAAITAGDTTFTLTGLSGNFEDYDIMLITEGSKMEMVQVIDQPDGDTVEISTGFLNSYTTNADIEWDFDIYNTRTVIKATQVYEPIGASDVLNMSSRVFRGAKYDMVYGEEVGNLLVYSLLEDDTIYRPIHSDRADSVQVIQEVKFNYMEKDMV